jgi:hypothetical protein
MVIHSIGQNNGACVCARPDSDLFFSIYACVMYGHWEAFPGSFLVSQQSEVATLDLSGGSGENHS